MERALDRVPPEQVGQLSSRIGELSQILIFNPATSAGHPAFVKQATTVFTIGSTSEQDGFSGGLMLVTHAKAAVGSHAALT